MSTPAPRAVPAPATRSARASPRWCRAAQAPRWRSRSAPVRRGSPDRAAAVRVAAPPVYRSGRFSRTRRYRCRCARWNRGCRGTARSRRIAGFDKGAVVGGVDVIPHLAGHGPVAGGGILLLAAFHVGHAGPPQRQGQHDPGVAHVGVDGQRRGSADRGREC